VLEARSSAKYIVGAQAQCKVVQLKDRSKARSKLKSRFWRASVWLVKALLVLISEVVVLCTRKAVSLKRTKQMRQCVKKSRPAV